MGSEEAHTNTNSPCHPCRTTRCSSRKATLWAIIAPCTSPTSAKHAGFERQRNIAKNLGFPLVVALPTPARPGIIPSIPISREHAPRAFDHLVVAAKRRSAPLCMYSGTAVGVCVNPRYAPHAKRSTPRRGRRFPLDSIHRSR